MSSNDDRAELQRRAQQAAVNAAERQYRESKNPLFVFEAYSHCRHEGLAIPDWVFRYFDDVAKALGALVDQTRAGPAIDEPNRQISEAFGIAAGRGQPTMFARFVDRWQNWEWLSLAVNVDEYMRSGRYNETGAIDQVAEDLAMIEKEAVAMGVTEFAQPTPQKSKIRAAWKRYQQEFPFLK